MKTKIARLLTFALLLVVPAGMAPSVRSATAQTLAGFEVGPEGATPYARIISGGSGTATLISLSPTKAYWITAAHVTKRKTARIYRKNDHTLEGLVIKKGGYDLALVRTSRATVWEKPLPIWWDGGVADREYWSEGYSGSRGLGRRKGEFRYRLRGGGAKWDFPSLPGDSGSSIWTVHKGRKFLAGITSTSDFIEDVWGRVFEGTITTGAGPGAIRSFMKECGFQIDEYGFANIPSVGSQQTPTKAVAGGRNHPDPILTQKIGIFGKGKLFARPDRPDT